MSQIRIRVGASLDTSATTVFVPVVEAARKARAQIQGELAAAGKALGAGPYRTNAKQAGEAIVGVGTSAKSTGAIIAKVNADAAKSFGMMAASAKKLPAELATVAREAERELRKIERSNARAALGLTKPANTNGGGVLGRQLRWGSIRVGDGASIGVGAGVATGVGLGRAGIGFARRLGMDLARGVGVETSWGKHVGDANALEASAVNLSNSALQTGAPGAAGMRVSPGAILGHVRNVANATAMSNEDVMGGLQSFVGKTGDLASGRDILMDLAKLSKATGTEMEHMVAAAGDVSNQLGDIPDKGAAIVRVMRVVAGQGKLGAVEIKDLASQMAKVAAYANSFEGGAEGNIATLGALAQSARQRGGAATASIAANSAMAFARDLVKPTNVANFQKAGINVFADKAKTKLRDPEEIILESLSKSGGNLAKLRKLFPNEMGFRAVGGFAQVYNNTGGSDADKLRAVDEEFKKLRDTMMGGGEIQASFNAAMATGQSKVQLMNNQMQAAADEIRQAFLPALISVAPALIGLTSKLVGWIGDVTGINADIANKKGTNAELVAGQTSRDLRASIERTPYTGLLTPEQQMEAGKKNLLGAQPALQKATEDEAALQKSIDEQRRLVAEQGKGGSGLSGTGGLRFNSFSELGDDQLKMLAQSPAGDQAAEYRSSVAKLKSMESTYAELKDLHTKIVQGLLAGELKVRVTNPKDIAGDKPPAAPKPEDGDAK